MEENKICRVFAVLYANGKEFLMFLLIIKQLASIGPYITYQCLGHRKENYNI